MKKLILKSKIASRDNFEDRLSRSADLDFGAIYWQHDRVYVPRGYRSAQNYPRLVMRTDLRAIDEPPTYYLVLRRHIEDSGIDIIEQTPVVDYSATVNIILQLGFKPTGEVSRRRQTLAVDDNTILHLDEIDGLGETYAKIETTITDDQSVAAARTRLTNFLTDLGETNFVSRAYFEL